jgi:hypothetical protein
MARNPVMLAQASIHRAASAGLRHDGTGAF